MAHEIPPARTSINAIGTLTKLKNQPGVNFMTPSAEKIANSFAANANIFRCIISDDKVINGDDGDGAIPMALRDCHVIDDVKAPSNHRQGFAGVGHSMSEAIETDYKGFSLSLSKTRETPLFSHERRWPDIMRTGIVPDVSVQPVDPSLDLLHDKLWRDYAPNQDHGFLSYSSKADAYISQLTSSLNNTNPKESILVRLGIDYFMPIANGRKVEFIENDKIHIVPSIDPLSWNKIPNGWRWERNIQVWKTDTSTELRVLYDGTMYEATSTKRGTKQTYKLEPSVPPAGENIGTIQFRAAYHDAWPSLQPEINYEGVNVVQWLSGTYFVRNPSSNCPKIVDHHEAKTLKSEMGTKQTVRSNCRFMVAFDAIPCDPLLAVTYNKQKLDAKQFHPGFQAVLEALQETFVDYALQNRSGAAPPTSVPRIRRAPNSEASSVCSESTIAEESTLALDSATSVSSPTMCPPKENIQSMNSATVSILLKERFGIEIEGGSGLVTIKLSPDETKTISGKGVANANLRDVLQVGAFSRGDKEKALKYLRLQIESYNQAALQPKS